MEKVSVIIPAYNAGHYLQSTLESVLNQTYENIEVLVIDDGSNDDTKSILKGFNDSRLKWWSRNNKGISATLNELIIHSTGDFIARMDSDDVMLPERISYQVEFLKSHNADICSGGYIAIGDDDLIFKPKIASDEIEKYLLIDNPVVHPTVIAKRHLFVVNKYNEKFNGAEDVDLWLRVLKNRKFIFIIDSKPVIKYRFHSQQSSHNSKQVILLGYLLSKHIKDAYGSSIDSNDIINFLRPKSNIEGDALNYLRFLESQWFSMNVKMVFLKSFIRYLIFGGFVKNNQKKNILLSFVKVMIKGSC